MPLTSIPAFGLQVVDCPPASPIPLCHRLPVSLAAKPGQGVMGDWGTSSMFVKAPPESTCSWGLTGQSLSGPKIQGHSICQAEAPFQFRVMKKIRNQRKL